MKFLIILMAFISSNVFAQSYKEQIAKHREAYKEDFLKETQSPIKEADLKNLQFFEPDNTYSIIAIVKLLKNEKIFKMPTYDGTSKDFIRYAKVKFILNDKPLELTLYRNIGLMVNPAYKNLLFLPFTDETNTTTTYGGGRYIDLDLTKIKNKKIEIDFNKAYNPYCAYSDGYRCPVPPKENDLAIEILAGEKLFTGEKKHQ
ncbi:DUF1684 domain-containing protein [Pedobacter cryotolerans]|uniref:DUF1684 domain-containing protein n=1 Tax=Pedobacter cryotolerans TaxID=2571270 RepID=A0A4U1C5W0_9SPHI|nr:DUF1684 domain-containing protein [Pedobacter cryotolerans]TKC01332.1 DUF1684 domain-containing protein [Pedobacter cryotolerans]